MKMTHEIKLGIRYAAEMAAAFFFYAVVLVVSIVVGRPMHASLERTLIEVSPMIPVLVVIIVIVRYFRRLDEYARVWALENIAIAGAVTAGWTLTYGFLENAGFSRLSMFTVWEVMGAVWGGLAILRCVLQR